MVAQPDPSPAVAPSATTMASKRDAPEGADGGRSASVKSTRISNAAVEMLSPVAIGDFAALAATPATSVAPVAVDAAPEVNPVAVVPKRTRGGARSVPPNLQPHPLLHPGSGRAPGDSREAR